MGNCLGQALALSHKIKAFLCGTAFYGALYIVAIARGSDKKERDHGTFFSDEGALRVGKKDPTKAIVIVTHCIHDSVIVAQ